MTRRDRGRLLVLDDVEAVAVEAAERFRREATGAVEARGRFTVALSGGSTPLRLYRALLRPGQGPSVATVPWSETHLFWGDERPVPPDDPDSNFRSAERALLSRVPVRPERVHRMRGEEEPAIAAEAYAATLRRSFGLAPGALPRFDLVLLGLGPDAHTASLFPGTDVLAGTERLVAAPWVPALGTFRLTLTPAVINHARTVMFLVAGAGKADALRAVLEGPVDPARYPAQIVQPRDGALVWLVDRAAAAGLSRRDAPDA